MYAPFDRIDPKEDFRTVLAIYLRAIQKRNVDVYMSTLSQHDPVVMLDDGLQLHGRVEIRRAQEQWFADPSWTYRAALLWTYESNKDALAVLSVRYDDFDERGCPRTRIYQHTIAFAFEIRGWKIVFERYTEG
ncbi:MAG: nuclear transport factor 2 family protein [Candidatus Eremiobacteraeota bacterium]|nr:nuclear transport factor 2 family protein [Candidatus Eremiobacteraeota bacterium]